MLLNSDDSVHQQLHPHVADITWSKIYLFIADMFRYTSDLHFDRLAEKHAQWIFLQKQNGLKKSLLINNCINSTLIPLCDGLNDDTVQIFNQCQSDR